MEQTNVLLFLETRTEELENKIAELIESDPTITDYAIAKQLCKNEANFNSFKVKVNRIHKKLFPK